MGERPRRGGAGGGRRRRGPTRTRSATSAWRARSTAWWPWTTGFEPLRDAIIWLDRRAVAEVDALTGKVGADAIFTTTGLAPDASHTAPKMMWLRDHEPEVFRAARSLPPVAGYLLARLTGVLAQDPANASSSLVYDVSTGTWSDCSSTPRGSTRRLAPIRASDEVAGPLAPAAAERLGPDAGLPGDRGHRRRARRHPRCRRGRAGGGRRRHRHRRARVRSGGRGRPRRNAWSRPTRTPRPGVLLVENPGFVSGGSTKWLAESVLGVDQGAVFDLAAQAPAGADGVISCPRCRARWPRAGTRTCAGRSPAWR